MKKHSFDSTRTLATSSLKKTSYKLALGVLCLMTVLSPVSCQKKQNSRKTQTAKLAFPSDPPTLDPRKGADIISSSIQFMLFEGLTRMSKQSTTELAGAKKIDVSDDNRLYTFHLRDTYWSDGSKVTAYDYEYSWKKILTPNFPAPSANLLYAIEGAENAKKGLLSLDEVGIIAINENTLLVKLQAPTPYFLELTSFCVFFPVKKDLDIAHPEWANNASDLFVSNGPFSLVSWKKQDSLNVKKNTQYWNHKRVHLQDVDVYFVDSENTAMQLYEKNQIDIIGTPFTSLPLDSIETLKNSDNLLMKPIAATTMCVFNVNQFPFTNKNIRHAFAIAIDRESITKNVTQLGEHVASGTIPPILKNNKTTKLFQDGNKELALQYLQKGLQELGLSLKDFPKLSYSHLTLDSHKKIAEAIQDQWFKVLGIHVSLEPTDYKSMLSKLSEKTFDMSQFSWVAQYNDQMSSLDRFTDRYHPKNYPGFENENYTRLIDLSRKTTDKEQRLLYMAQAEKIFVEEMPLTPLFHWNYALLKSPYLKDFYVSPIGSVHIEECYIENPEKGVALGNLF